MQLLFLMCKKERRERNYAGSPQRCHCRCVVDCHVADGNVAAASCVTKGNGEESHVACLVCCLLLVVRSPMVSWPLLLMWKKEREGESRVATWTLSIIHLWLDAMSPAVCPYLICKKREEQCCLSGIMRRVMTTCVDINWARWRSGRVHGYGTGIQ